MKTSTWIALATALIVAGSAFAQDYSALTATAAAQYRHHEYAASVATFQAAFKIRTANGVDLYNAACASARAGDPTLALTWLRQACDTPPLAPVNPTILKHLLADPDLASLHELDGWKALTAQLQQTVEAKDAGIDRPLQRELQTIYENDQQYRRQVDGIEKQFGHDSPQVRALWKTIEEHDAEDLAKVEAILARDGWVGPDKVGPASVALFLVIQHSDHATQEKYLPLMREAVKAHRAPAAELALLEDRVALGEGRPQTYGSQIGYDAKTGQHYVRPLVDPGHVDERRAAVGLPPLAGYVKQWGITWDPAAYARQLPTLEAARAGENAPKP